jgi:membrane protein
MWTIVVQFFRDVRQAIERLYADDGPVLAAATAYYLGLSFFPLLLVLTAGIGWFLRYTHPGQSAQQEVLHSIATAASEQLADYVAQTLDMVQDRSSINGPLGLATMLITALAAFTQLDSAFKRIWRVADSGSKSIFLQALAILAARGRAFLVLLGLGALVVLVFLAGMVIQAVESQTNAVMPLEGWVWDAVQIGVTMTTNIVVFMLLFRLLPQAPVRWSDAFYGGFLTAAAWEIGRQLLAVFIARSKYTSAYGVIGAFLAVLLWCYYAVTIVLLGAEYIQIISHRDNDRPADQPSNVPK